VVTVVLTVTVEVAVWVVSRFPVAVIVDVPAETEVTSPVLLTVATDVLVDDQVTPKSGSVNPPAVSCWPVPTPLIVKEVRSIDGTAGP
jgi:hypothetical protein